MLMLLSTIWHRKLDTLATVQWMLVENHPKGPFFADVPV
jgi:hypothetical protein